MIYTESHLRPSFLPLSEALRANGSLGERQGETAGSRERGADAGPSTAAGAPQAGREAGLKLSAAPLRPGAAQARTEMRRQSERSEL